MRALLALFFGLSICSTTLASSDSTDVGYLNFAVCNGTIDGTAVRLQFFEKHHGIGEGSATGEGLMVQTLTAPPEAELQDDEMKEIAFVNQLKIKTVKNARIVEISAALDAKSIFANVTIPDNKKFNLEIFAIQFGQVWGNFSCISQF